MKPLDIVSIYDKCKYTETCLKQHKPTTPTYTGELLQEKSGLLQKNIEKKKMMEETKV